LQKELDQAKKDLETAKATPAAAATPATPATATEPTSSAPLADSERETLETKYKDLEAEHKALNDVGLIHKIWRSC